MIGPFGAGRPANDEPVPEDTDVDAELEVAQVLRRRRREALAAGMSPVEARLFAESEIDIGQLRHLVAAGCPDSLLAKVLL